MLDENKIFTGDIPVALRTGKLVRIEIGPNRFMQMYEDEAIRRGLLPAKPEAQKELPPPANKMRRPPQNKGG